MYNMYAHIELELLYGVVLAFQSREYEHRRRQTGFYISVFPIQRRSDELETNTTIAPRTMITAPLIIPVSTITLRIKIAYKRLMY